eukprot:TRINITY_DN1011_c0_g1_i1.p1 TRINITY_DN1011_c0_g1~~TRINITY_DN1011_c0_g1_i1.p1  ORF type:complete len:552 (+),score=116.39 TRINITY_DN1011_c0_g1_i1:79-1734(+)
MNQREDEIIELKTKLEGEIELGIEQRINCYYRIGKLYLENKDDINAKKYLKEGLKTAKERRMKFNFLFLLAHCYDTAEKQFDHGLKAEIKAKSLFERVQIQNLLINLSIDSRNFNEASYRMNQLFQLVCDRIGTLKGATEESVNSESVLEMIIPLISHYLHYYCCVINVEGIVSASGITIAIKINDLLIYLPQKQFNVIIGHTFSFPNDLAELYLNIVTIGLIAPFKYTKGDETHTLNWILDNIERGMCFSKLGSKLSKSLYLALFATNLLLQRIDYCVHCKKILLEEHYFATSMDNVNTISNALTTLIEIEKLNWNELSVSDCFFFYVCILEVFDSLQSVIPDDVWFFKHYIYRYEDKLTLFTRKHPPHLHIIEDIAFVKNGDFFINTDNTKAKLLIAKVYSRVLPNIIVVIDTDVFLEAVDILLAYEEIDYLAKMIFGSLEYLPALKKVSFLSNISPTTFELLSNEDQTRIQKIKEDLRFHQSVDKKQNSLFSSFIVRPTDNIVDQQIQVVGNGSVLRKSVVLKNPEKKKTPNLFSTFLNEETLSSLDI